MSIALLQLIETRLATHSPGKKWLRPLMKRAAVALILQLRGGDLHILMIKRAEHENDPWSGHMAFPGGRKETTDVNGFAAAVRETREEIGLQLGDEDACLGRLSDLRARPGIRGGLAVTPYVFRVERELRFTLNYEVAEVVWVPLSFLLNTDNRKTMIWKRGALQLPMPCYDYRQRRIWGLSLMMLDELMDLVEGRNALRKMWRRR